jgi:hypothetical protein
MNPPSSWKQFLESALLESDPHRLPERIQRARIAIMDRVEQLLDDRERQPEHDEIVFALNRLDNLAARSDHPR